MKGAKVEELLAEQAIKQLITTIVAMTASGVLGFLIAKIKGIGKWEKARITIEKATARRLIFEAYDDHVVQGKPLTVDRAREIKETFDAYTVLGGNGTAKSFFEAIAAIPPVLVTK